MHQCEDFRERITEHIIDREDLTERPEFRRELLICPSCSEFYAESRELMEALSSVDFAVSEDRWNAMNRRLRMRIGSVQPKASPRRAPWSLRMYVPAVASIAAVLLLTFVNYRLATPLIEEGQRISSIPEYLEIDRIPVLDPVTVDFLEQSELLLRNVMKIGPADTEDVVDAKRLAVEQLGEITQRKEAAADVPPVVNVMETYETVLRDLRNLDGPTLEEDITDIQNRIQRNALIANMKVFQPSVTLVNFNQE